ncbi:MAG: class I SAM-dependent methyltransferase [Desulfobacterales bacterium]|nr:MAG: class I SAM-dependent methyltransferase [Desulfobacterales bacterium]
MSYQSLLKILYARKPIFDVKRAILSAPVRHIFMIATIWFLTAAAKKDDLHILEIGSWYGASTLSWAQGLELYNAARGAITCVDAWSAFFDMNVHAEVDYVRDMEEALATDAAYNIFLHNSRTLPQTIQCQHMRGLSQSILPQLREKYYDVVFIDGDHAYDAVKEDIRKSMRLVKEQGVICGDDLNLQLHECDVAVAQEKKRMDFVQDPQTGKNYHPGVTLAVAEQLGEVSSWAGFWMMQKQGRRWEKVSLKGMPVVYPKHFPDDAIRAAKSHFEDIAASIS